MSHEIDGLRRQLDDAYRRRAAAIRAAHADGHSLREIAAMARVSLTAVVKAARGG